jgi:hypothetical protein
MKPLSLREIIKKLPFASYNLKPKRNFSLGSPDDEADIATKNSKFKKRKLRIN